MNLKVASILIALVLGIVLFFQNCAEPLQLASEDALSYNNQLPFAYDTKIDTLAYMSCSSSERRELDNRGVFSFRVGAYADGSGLALSEGFKQTTQNFRPTQIAAALQESARNKDAVLQLSMRLINDFSVIMTNSPSAAVRNKDYWNILAPLDSQEVALSLGALEEGQRLNYLQGHPTASERFLEGSISFWDEGEARASSVRERLQNEAYLTMTYSDATSDAAIVRSPTAGDYKTAYGKGYKVSFRVPSGGAASVRNALNEVREVDLETGRMTGADLGTWDCPGNGAYTFRIVKNLAADLTASGCRAIPDPAPNILAGNAILKDRLEVIRRVLRTEYWWVDIERNCVIPKDPRASCYGPRETVDYTANSATCIAGVHNNGVAPHACPHFVSVCVRK